MATAGFFGPRSLRRLGNCRPSRFLFLAVAPFGNRLVDKYPNLWTDGLAITLHEAGYPARAYGYATRFIDAFGLGYFGGVAFPH